jgi:hypothetical protein
MIVTGVVEKRYDNETNITLQIAGKRYSDYKGQNFKGQDIREGTTVSFEMIQNGQYLNVNGPISVTTDAPAVAAAETGAVTLKALTSTQTQIIRQNAVTNANAFYAHTDSGASITPDKVVETARIFESYYDGTLDAEELNSALGQ